jgi:hypothetical protein
MKPAVLIMAERVGFEPTLRKTRRPLFESGTISLSDTSPRIYSEDNLPDILSSS